MSNSVEAMRKRIEEIHQKNDAYLASRVPGFDPEKAKASREKLREAVQKKAASTAAKTSDPETLNTARDKLRELMQKGTAREKK